MGSSISSIILHASSLPSWHFAAKGAILLHLSAKGLMEISSQRHSLGFWKHCDMMVKNSFASFSCSAVSSRSNSLFHLGALSSVLQTLEYSNGSSPDRVRHNCSICLEILAVNAILSSSLRFSATIFCTSFH